MKFEIYPQLFDKYGVRYKHPGQYNHLHYKYRADELKGASLQKYDELIDNVKMLNKKMLFPRLFFMITGLIFLILATGALEALDIGIKKAYKNAPVFFGLLPVFFVLTIIAILFFLYKRKHFLLAMAELNQTIGIQVDKSIEQNFDIPPNAITVSFFQRNYRMGKTKPSFVSRQAFLMFEDSATVYIYWEAALFKVPKRDCIAAEIIEAKLGYRDVFPNINYNSPEIKQYKIRRNPNNGIYMTKSFGRLLFVANGETWTIDVPPFAFETIKKIFSKE